MGQKAVFLDRDGTLIVDKHYLSDPAQVEYMPGAFEALKIIQEKGYLIFLVTNQSGIGRGYFKEEDMIAVHERIASDMEERGFKLSGVAFCPHTPDDNCECRKPRPKMILDLMAKHDVTEGFMLGDKPIDAAAGEAAGIRGIHLTMGESEYPKVASLIEFAQGLP